MSEVQLKSVWATLSRINVESHVKEKNKLKYLSWAWAWGITKEAYPDLVYMVFEYNGLPYISSPLGFMVKTEVTIQNQTLSMMLPVLDGANKPQKADDYEYEVNGWEDGKKCKVKKQCIAANMFDINTAIMRCLTKNLAMFGLGHYIYAGEDLPIPELASNIQIAEINDLIKETNTDKKTLLDYYRVSNVEEMFESTILSAISQLTNKKVKK